MLLLGFLLCTLALKGFVIANEEDPRAALVRKICDQDAKVYFESPQDVSEMIKIIESDETICNAKFRQSFIDLKEVLSDTVLKDVCSTDAYLILRQYYLSYISAYTPESSKEELLSFKQGVSLNPIPVSLREFFILFVQQISGLCKRDLVARLPTIKVKNRDFTLMESMKSEGARLFGYTYVPKAKKLGDLVIPMSRIERNSHAQALASQVKQANNPGSYGGSITVAMQQHLASRNTQKPDYVRDGSDAGKLYIQVRFGDKFMFMQQACVHRLIPVYDELFVPVIRLNNLGFDDSLNTEFEMDMLTFESEFTRWYNIIQTCEILRDIEIVQDTSVDVVAADIVRMLSPLNQSTKKGKSVVELADSKMLIILTAQEALELKQKNAAGVKSQKSVNLEEPESIMVEHEPVTFTPLMWLTLDSLCTSAIKHFENRNGKLIKKQTDFFILLKDKLINDLMSRLHRYKLQIVHKDRSSGLGSIASFVDKHQTGIKVVGLTLAVLVLAMHLG